MNIFKGYMAHSGDIWVLSKIVELARRCGVSPAIASVELTLTFDKDDNYHYTLLGMDGRAETPEDRAGVEKVYSLLGLNELGTTRRFDDLPDVEKAVDHALSLAPRARVR